MNLEAINKDKGTVVEVVVIVQIIEMKKEEKVSNTDKNSMGNQSLKAATRMIAKYI